MTSKTGLLAGTGGLAVFAQASGLDLARDFNGGIEAAAARCMIAARHTKRLERFAELTAKLESLTDEQG